MCVFLFFLFEKEPAYAEAHYADDSDRSYSYADHRTRRQRFVRVIGRIGKGVSAFAGLAANTVLYIPCAEYVGCLVILASARTFVPVLYASVYPLASVGVFRKLTVLSAADGTYCLICAGSSSAGMRCGSSAFVTDVTDRITCVCVGVRCLAFSSADVTVSITGVFVYVSLFYGSGCAAIVTFGVTAAAVLMVFKVTVCVSALDTYCL